VGGFEVGDFLLASNFNCVRTKDSIRFLDAVLALFCRLPMTCLSTVRCLALLPRAVGGPASSLVERRGFIAARFGTGFALALPFWVSLGLFPGSALALPTLMFWVCLGPSPFRVGSVAVCSVTGVLRRVCR
jgi:hypothetical protein